MKILLSGTILLVFSFAILFGFTQDILGNVLTEIKRLNPAEFTDLPPKVVRELEQRGCTIPQVYESKKRMNIIRGEFAKPGQKDWVVLCSHDGVSSILVFWGRDVPACSNEIAKKEDKNFLQGIDNGQMGFSREIAVASKEFIESMHKTYRGPKPPPIDHQGIDDRFINKASVVYYCYEGKWLQLQGSD